LARNRAGSRQSWSGFGRPRVRRQTSGLGVTGTVHMAKLLKSIAKSGSQSNRRRGTAQDRRSDSPSHISQLPSLSSRSLSPSNPSYPSRLPRTTLSLRHVFQTRADASPAILDTSHAPRSGRSPALRASQHASLPAADPVSCASTVDPTL